MGIKIKKISEWNFYQRLMRFIVAVIALFFAVFYLGALIRPDWSEFIKNPMLHQAIAYLVIGCICILMFLVLAIFVSNAVEHFRLIDVNKKQEQELQKRDKKVEELEAELRRLQTS